ncbi:MAG: DUF559 domain-containing protein [Chloroflexota bacterium]
MSSRRTTLFGSKDYPGLLPDWYKKGTPCVICGKPTAENAAACSRSCGQIWNVRKRKPEVEAERRRKIAIRMREVRKEIPNPMEDSDTRKKVSETLIKNGHKPPTRGGNGTGPSVPERLLYDELTRLSPTLQWRHEFVVALGSRPVKGGLPGHYKIDLASPEKMIAVEVDGYSHRAISRRESDRRKDEILESLGWYVFRVSNQAVNADVAKVAMEILSTR